MPKNESYGGPKFVPEINADVGKIQTDQAARTLAEPGFPIDRASAYFRNLMAAGLIHPYSRQPNGKRAYYFRPDQLVVAAILNRMSDAGIAGEKQRHAASLALQSWRNEDLKRTEADIQSGALLSVPRSPAMWALIQHIQGVDGLNFEMLTWHNPKTGQKRFSARVRNIDGNGTNFLVPGENWVRRSVFAIALDDVLAHLTRAREVEN